MKASEMTNEHIAEELAATIPHLSDEALACTDADDILREAATRLRRPTPVDDDLLKMARDIDALRVKLKVAEDALDASLNYNNSEELRKAQRKAKKALAAIREEGGAK